MFHLTGAIIRWMLKKGDSKFENLKRDDLINIPLGLLFWGTVLVLPNLWIRASLVVILAGTYIIILDRE